MEKYVDRTGGKGKKEKCLKGNISHGLFSLRRGKGLKTKKNSERERYSLFKRHGWGEYM